MTTQVAQTIPAASASRQFKRPRPPRAIPWLKLFMAFVLAAFFPALSGCNSIQATGETVVTPTPSASAERAFVRSGQVLQIKRTNGTVSIKADGGDVVITGDNLTVTIGGDIAYLIVNGDSNSITSDNSDVLELNGNRNRSNGKTVSQRVRIEGGGNVANFAGAPSVRVRGPNTTVNGERVGRE